jgi:hypothetical protein
VLRLLEVAAACSARQRDQMQRESDLPRYRLSLQGMLARNTAKSYVLLACRHSLLLLPAWQTAILPPFVTSSCTHPPCMQCNPSPKCATQLAHLLLCCCPCYQSACAAQAAPLLAQLLQGWVHHCCLLQWQCSAASGLL